MSYCLLLFYDRILLIAAKPDKSDDPLLDPSQQNFGQVGNFDVSITGKMSSDTLFPVRNSFYLGAYQAAIAEAADLDTLSEKEKIERDVFVYRSYIELGSYEVICYC